MEEKMENKLNYGLDIQLFSDEGTSTDSAVTDSKTDDGNGVVKTGAESKPKTPTEPEKKYTDADVNEIVEEKLAKAKKAQEKAVQEAEKLAKMNAQEKAEHERDQLQTELEELKKKDTLSEMSKVARKMLSDEGINVSDVLLTKIVSEDAEETKGSVDDFISMFNEAVDSAVKNKLKSSTPKSGATAPKSTLTKEQIMAVKDDTERKKLIAQNPELFIRK